MKIIAQPIAIQRLSKLAIHDDPVIDERLNLLAKVDALRAAGLTAAQACRHHDISPSTYYEWRARARCGHATLRKKSTAPRRRNRRQWSMADAKRVLDIRRGRPWEGANRVHLAHNRQYPNSHLSLSHRRAYHPLGHRHRQGCCLPCGHRANAHPTEGFQP